jgi:hypothetical protein
MSGSNSTRRTTKGTTSAGSARDGWTTKPWSSTTLSQGVVDRISALLSLTSHQHVVPATRKKEAGLLFPQRSTKGRKPGREKDPYLKRRKD